MQCSLGSSIVSNGDLQCHMTHEGLYTDYQGAVQWSLSGTGYSRTWSYGVFFIAT